MVVGFLEILSPLIYGLYVEELAKRESMEKRTLSENAFARYPCARYATDVTLQQANISSGRQAERKRYYSKKHKLHGYKVEVSVLPTGFAVDCTRHYPGNVADIAICRENMNFHRHYLTKTPAEERLADGGPLLREYPHEWAVLCDKGYQGLATVLRAIHPVKKPRGRPYTLAQQTENHEISHDRIIVENFFGRLCTLWVLCSQKYRWNEGLYDTIFRACVALTNAHARWSPLRPNDGEEYRAYLRRLIGIEKTRAKRRKEIQQRSRRNRAIRLRNSTMTLPADSGVDDSMDYSTEY